MASTCFCGCGTEVGGIRRRANNEVADQMVQHLAVMNGALGRGDAGSKRAQTQAMAEEGAVLLASITRYLHGEAERDDLDRGRIKTWSKQAGSLTEELLAAAGGPAWEPADRQTDHLALTGERATGVITDVRSKGWGNDRVASLTIDVSVRTADGRAIDLSRSLSIAVVQAPRIGDHVEVAYDPSDPACFIYRPLVQLPHSGNTPPV